MGRRPLLVLLQPPNRVSGYLQDGRGTVAAGGRCVDDGVRRCGLSRTYFGPPASRADSGPGDSVRAGRPRLQALLPALRAGCLAKTRRRRARSSRALDPFDEHVEGISPKQRQARVLCLLQVVPLENAGEHGGWHGLRRSKLANPNASLYDGVVVEALDGVGRAVADLALKWQLSTVPEPDRKVRLAAAEHRLAAELSCSRRVG